MEITRYANLSESQFLGCASAFVESLAGELGAVAMYLRKLEGRPKGSAFAYEMCLDHHRYGAVMVLDRWARLADAFGPHLKLSRRQSMLDEAAGRVQTAENILGRANSILDAAESYSGDIVNACVMALQSVNTVFAEEQQAAAQSASLGPMLPEDYQQARRVFLQDLAAR